MKTKAKNYNFKNLFLKKERDYFVENLSMLVSSGMLLTSALNSILEEVHSKRMKRIIKDMTTDIESGISLGETLERAGIFPEHTISLIKLGERSGKLTESLKVVAVEQEKSRVFKSKLRSAMMYPILVLSLTVIIGTGISWFILPRLAMVFNQLRIEMPIITEVLINLGNFLGEYGYYAVPVIIIFIIFLLFLIFFFSKTKSIGQFILLSIPGIKNIIKEVELARFGYLLGTLLQAGLPINNALDSLVNATEISQYRKFYIHLRDSVEDGNSIKKSFASFKNTKRLIPSPVKQLIVTAEQSGTLSETLLKIGKIFESKSDTTTKNITIILEPILLVIVWLGVVAVALAVILPIYNLIGGL